MGYITPEGREAVKRYAYKGEDRSLLYKYVLSPFAQACVDWFTPLHLAPNVITLIGLGFQFLAFAAVFSSSFDLSTPPPRWSCAVAGACLFIYSTLDNMDGKQARRTGSSSALGLLFDHGCDAFNAGVLGPLIFAKCVVAGPASWRSVMLWMCATSPFFMNTWEEFHTQAFILPLVNGPNEGLMTLVSFFFASAVWGPRVWHSTAVAWDAGMDLNALLELIPAWQVPYAALAHYMAPVIRGIRVVVQDPSTAPATYLELALAATAVGGGITVLFNTATVLREVLSSPSGRVMHALGRQSPMWLLNASAAAWLCFPVTRSVATSHSFMYFITAGVIFADFTSKLMVSHACDQRYRPEYAASLLFGAPPVLAFLHTQGWVHVPSGWMDETAVTLALLAAFTIATASYIMFAYDSIVTVATTLDIDVFDITKQRRRAGKL